MLFLPYWSGHPVMWIFSLVSVLHPWDTINAVSKAQTYSYFLQLIIATVTSVLAVVTTFT
jgi:hypothetical protein